MQLWDNQGLPKKEGQFSPDSRALNYISKKSGTKEDNETDSDTTWIEEHKENLNTGSYYPVRA